MLRKLCLPLLFNCLLLTACSAPINSPEIFSGPVSGESRFEPSGAAWDGASGRLLVLNDKSDEPPVYLYSLEQDRRLRLEGQFAVLDAMGNPIEAKKFEDLTTTNQPGRFLAVTACDRPDPAYNKLLAIEMSSGAPVFEELSFFPEVIEKLHQEIGYPFLKIEGLAMSRDGKTLYLGIREVGPDYKNPQYIVSVWGLDLSDPSMKLYNVFTFDLTQVIGRDVGLSAMEIDPDSKDLLFLTSYEVDDTASGVGGHLWSTSSTPPFPLPRSPLAEFNNKPEGLATMSNGKLIITFDDDNVRKEADPEKAAAFNKFPIKANQAFYVIMNR